MSAMQPDHFLVQAQVEPVFALKLSIQTDFENGVRSSHSSRTNVSLLTILEPNMSYQQQLSPWVIHQQLPNLKRVVIARFRHRNDSEAYLKLVSRMMPHAKFAIAFEMQPSEPATPAPSTTPDLAPKKPSSVSLA